MTAFNRSTWRRLRNLPQPFSVWEGDRRPLSSEMSVDMALNADEEDLEGDCILWVDGTNGVVRAIDIVPSETGHEAVVRTLLKAIEQPQSAEVAARPKKIVVRNREIQFFLRGALQNLDIIVDYVPELPLIDEIFRGLKAAMGNHPPQLPESWAESLIDRAYDIWKDAPWNYLNEQQLIEVKLNQWDIETFYVSILGMAGVEYGILMYHSLDSLKQFRERITRLAPSSKQLQQVFLEQDCLFLTFDRLEDVADVEEFEAHIEHSLDWANSFPIRVAPSFGSLHPLEGLRTSLSPEEAMAVLVTLEALHQFFDQYQGRLRQHFSEMTSRHHILSPEFHTDADVTGESITVSLKTLPGLVDELDAITQGTGDSCESGVAFPIVKDDLVPDNSLISLSMVSPERIETLREMHRHYQPSEIELFPTISDFPILMIQTSQPKAKKLIQAIQEAGGAAAICFNASRDPFSGAEYDLGLFQTKDGAFHLFSEYEREEPGYLKQRQHWDQACVQNHDHCGIIISRGLTGANRGNPQLRDMLALFEVPIKTAQDSGLMMPQSQLELDWF